MKKGHVVFTLVVVAAAFLYAILRYHIIKGVAWEHFPLYISNKAIALAAVALLALSYLVGALAHIWPDAFGKYLEARKLFGLLGFGLAGTHIVITLIIFSPAYYPKFYAENGMLNLTGELTIMFGILSVIFFYVVALTSLPGMVEGLGHELWQKAQHVGYLGLIAVAGHVFTMGYAGWLDSAGWPGGLLPISLIAFIIVLTALLMKLIVLLFYRSA